MGHVCIRICLKCGLKQKFHDPDDKTTTSEAWIDAKMGNVWHKTTASPPKHKNEYNEYKGRFPKKIIHQGLSD